MEGSRSGSQEVGGQGFSRFGEALPEGVVEREVGDRAEWLGWRKRNVNASEAACLFGEGIHPYMSAYKLWAERSGKLADQADNPAMKRGRLLEDDAIELAQAERPGWQIWRPNHYLSHAGWRIGATPDAYFDSGARHGVLQIKTVGRYAFNRDWKDKDTGEITPPLWIAVQASVEAFLSRRDLAAVGAMVISDGGLLDMHIMDVPLKDGILTRLRTLTEEFWRRVDDDDPYPVDWGRDLETFLALHREDDGSEIDLTGDQDIRQMLVRRAGLKRLEKDGESAREKRREVDGRLIERMGNARKATFGDQAIYATNIQKRAYTVAAQNYRFIRVKGEIDERQA